MLFILLAYLSYPTVYKILHMNQTDYSQLIILIIIALLIQMIPRIVTPALYSNIEILLGRFLVFFIGCWCGKKVYQNEFVNNKERMGVLFGAGVMLCQFLPIVKKVVLKLGYRFTMCFWGIFLLYCIIVNIQKIPHRIIQSLEWIGKMSYELYLTHVAVRALMNIVGLKTYYIQHYIFCILISLFLTNIIVKLQRRMIYAA